MKKISAVLLMVMLMMLTVSPCMASTKNPTKAELKAQIVQLQSEIEQKDAQIADLQADNALLKARAKSLANAVSSLCKIWDRGNLEKYVQRIPALRVGEFCRIMNSLPGLYAKLL